MIIRKKGDQHRYWVRDEKCIGAQCLALGLFQHRGAIGCCGQSKHRASLADLLDERLSGLSA
jgi:hypothetical protein